MDSPSNTLPTPSSDICAIASPMDANDTGTYSAVRTISTPLFKTISSCVSHSQRRKSKNFQADTETFISQLRNTIRFDNSETNEINISDDVLLYESGCDDESEDNVQERLFPNLEDIGVRKSTE
ncbi:3975_t:CDS:1 [Paraglomus occultum]|uniref:3975_t:CDS:1 n=1 Tax=Paraglomus occultum TaxID=144539 RepID=A0A9N9FSH9_9GLOM|nr:3975_t:CDS:1 [Paraglomus occultum]